MKIYILAILAFATTISVSAQQHVNGGIINLNFGNQFRSAEVTYYDGVIEKGLLKGFIENNTLEFGDFSGLDHFEGYLNLDDNKFLFKTDENSEVRKLSRKEIKEVVLIEHDRRKLYRLLNIIAVKDGKEIIDLKRPVWLPVLFEDASVSIYGFNLFINGKYILTYTYLSKDKINAIKPFDNMAGAKTAKDAYKVMLNYAFNNCSQMKPSIDGYWDRALQEYADGEVKIKQVHKDKSLSKDQKKAKELDIHQSKVVDPLIALIQKFKTDCL